ncbi:MAG TPA: hypothetical protein VLL54_14680 [Pyrinomonadaceae bacterium]|nr:hypothetical protein [Pyrinomonadaceae bacterium]
MKTIALGAVLSLFVISSAAPVSLASGGPSASGSYRFVMDDDLTKTVEFSVQADDRGNASGSMMFTDEARISERNPDSEDPRDDLPSSFFVRATFNALTVDRNRAVMDGVVYDSSNRSVIGKWIQLVVEDNGTDADQVNWRLCEVLPGGWVPVDAEDPRDGGAYLHWWATDFENRDDVGIASASVMPGLATSCESISLANFSFAEIRGAGQIEVRP